MLRQLLRAPTLTKIQHIQSSKTKILPEISALWVPSHISPSTNNILTITDIKSYGYFDGYICVDQCIFDSNDKFIASVCRANTWDRLVRFSKFYRDPDTHVIAFEVSGVPMRQYSSLGFDAVIIDTDEEIESGCLSRSEPQNLPLQAQT